MNILNKITIGVTHYNKYGDKVYFGKPVQKIKKLAAGIYTIGADRSGEVYLSPMSAMTDTLIRLPDFTSETIIKEVDKFWSTETKAKFEKRKLIYKRGIILHGLPGVGKSACIAQIMEAEVNAGGIVFFCPDPSLLCDAVKRIREIEGNSLRFLVVWEEFDELIGANESAYLSLLDGEMQIDNVVYIATTNYLERIPDRFKRRPSRFASVTEVGLPNEETRMTYLNSKIYPEENIDVSIWAKETKGFTIDHIKDLIISVLCLDVPFKEAIDRLKGFSYAEDKEDERINQKVASRRNKRKEMFNGLWDEDSNDDERY